MTCPPPAPRARRRGDDGAPPLLSPAPPARALSLSARPARRTSSAAFFEEPPEEDDPLLGFAPYLHAAPRRNSITPERQRMFIAALAASGIVTQAARAIGASLEALYKLRHRKGAEGFSAAWDMAIDRGMMRLEDCALERAIQGEERPVVSMGEVVATYTRHDTTLMLFLLRTRRAARYTADPRDPQPGSALYQRVLADYQSRQPSSDVILDRINAKIERMRQNHLAEEAALAEARDACADEELESYGGA